MKTENNNLKNKNYGLYQESHSVDLIDENKGQYTVLDRSDLDDIYDDFDGINSTPENRHQKLEVEKVNKHDISIDDRFLNGRELSRYDDIAEIIENDRRKAKNYKNFQKNNVKFYKSIEDQIFEETKRILDLEDLDVYQEESFKEVHLVGEKYQTTNDSVNTIISVAAEKDKKFLDLISDESSITNQKRPQFVNLKTNIEDVKIDDYKENNEFVSKEIEAIPPYNQELNDLNEKPEFETEMTSPPPIPPKSIPIVDLINSQNTSPSSDAANNKTPPSPPPVIPTVTSPQPTAPKQVFSPDNSMNTFKPLPEIVKPSSTLTDTEYEKIKKYINNYNKLEHDAIANGINPIKVSDALKVNLYKNFYLTQKDLLDSKKEQDKNLNNMINEYEKTLRDINDYEVKKEIRNFENKTVPFVSTVTQTKESLKNDVLNSQLILNENKDLKNKIKELEEKITETIKSKKDPQSIVEDSSKSVKVEIPKSTIPTTSVKFETKPTESIKSEISKKEKLEEVAKNTLQAFDDSKKEEVSLEKSFLKKPITFKEQTNLSIYSGIKKNNPDEESKRVSINDALNKKKTALFSSFNNNEKNSTDKPAISSLADALKKKK